MHLYFHFVHTIGNSQRHASYILSAPPRDYLELFSELGEVFFEMGMWEDARGVWEVLGADVETSSVHVLMRAAACRRRMGEVEEAGEVYEHSESGSLRNFEPVTHF